MSQDYLAQMIDMVRRGGEIARGLAADSVPTFKPDRSVVTLADTAVSRHVREKLRGLLDQGHILLDEEDPHHQRYFDADVLARAPGVWVLDPIDGTRPFSNQMPFYGISLGLLKDLKPWLGAVYFPELGQLFYGSAEEAYFVEQAFTPSERRRRIVPLDQDITQQSIFFMCDIFFKKYEWNYQLCHVVMPACAVVDLCWPALGRGCGCFFNAYLWDFAGSWPLFRAAGLDLRAFPDGRVLDRLDLSLFRGDDKHPWRLKDYYVLSSERNFALIRENIRPRGC